MLNCVYRLVAPRTFEPVLEEVSLAEDTVLVRPTHLSICNADMRYYLGRRSAEALARKLPMALIHEGVGEVVRDGSGQFAAGQHVVMLPNNPHETDPYIAENYLRSSEFCGSGFDGFMQELVALQPSRVIALPEGMDMEVAAFTEMMSVAMHALVRFESIAHPRHDRIGIWGDGNLGFFVSLALRERYPDSQLVVIGHSFSKLSDFTFVDETHLSTEIDGMAPVDHAFECCGGDGSTRAIEQIIDLIRPEGTISLLGVSENQVPINTRMVLEKGLRLFGSSRSGRADFLNVVKLYEEHPETLSYLQAMVGEVIDVCSIRDIAAAFEADTRKSMGKTIMRWHM
ncbi:MAG: alcohol dehydrogenase catalytic domain-containing protein [Coriobacteriales bacterium]|jgi:ribitol-5-phosphate 2-dehydrogenase